MSGLRETDVDLVRATIRINKSRDEGDNRFRARF